MERTRKRQQNLEAYGHARSLPASLCARLRRHFDQMAEKKELMSQAHIVNQLPDVLVAKIANFSCRDLINACSLFTGAPEQYLTMLAVRLRPKLLLPGELLFKKVRVFSLHDLSIFLNASHKNTTVGRHVARGLLRQIRNPRRV